jgi:hypothetical protein
MDLPYRRHWGTFGDQLVTAYAETMVTDRLIVLATGSSRLWTLPVKIARPESKSPKCENQNRKKNLREAFNSTWDLQTEREWDAPGQHVSCSTCWRLKMFTRCSAYYADVGVWSLRSSARRPSSLTIALFVWGPGRTRETWNRRQDQKPDSGGLLMGLFTLIYHDLSWWTSWSLTFITHDHCHCHPHQGWLAIQWAQAGSTASLQMQRSWSSQEEEQPLDQRPGK